MNSLRRVASLRLRSHSTAPLTAIHPVDAAYTDGLRTGGSMYELSMQKVSRECGSYARHNPLEIRYGWWRLRLSLFVLIYTPAPDLLNQPRLTGACKQPVA